MTLYDTLDVEAHASDREIKRAYRWLEWPARDDLSLLASVGVVGALFGAATAGAVGGARDPA